MSAGGTLAPWTGSGGLSHAFLLIWIGFGTIWVIVPIVYAEAYVIALGKDVKRITGPISIAIGIAIGWTLGKLVFFLGVLAAPTVSVKHRR